MSKASKALESHDPVTSENARTAYATAKDLYAQADTCDGPSAIIDLLASAILVEREIAATHARTNERARCESEYRARLAALQIRLHGIIDKA